MEPTKKNQAKTGNNLFTTTNEKMPDFKKLLESPLVKEDLPNDFNKNEEIEHLGNLFKETDISKYTFESFVHSGGSGMVFKVRDTLSNNILALKIARKKLFNTSSAAKDATRLSPVSVKELNALQNLSHPNVVRLFDAITDNSDSIVAIATTYVEKPQPLNLYITDILSKHKEGISPFSPSRLDNACKFLVQKFIEIASAIDHMHSVGYYHMDVKPANILLSKNHSSMLTDLGACVFRDDIDESDKSRVQFTWTYAHPDLTTMTNNPGEISGGGLKSSSEIKRGIDLAKFDLFAFGRTMQETLAILEAEFGERCHANYAFRFLHFLACLCLDGKNALDTPDKKIINRNGVRFVSDIALNYPQSIFNVYKIKKFKDLLEKFNRFSREYSWFQQIPELDPWLQDKLNTGNGKPAPYTQRVAKITGHPAFRRLKLEPQLGWIREVFPGATHNRWSHSIGVFSAVIDYYNALLADPDVPSFRIIVLPGDICHAMVAALIHDIGQFSFGHDIEAALPDLYKHEELIERILDEKTWGEETLRDVIKKYWGEIDINRILSILSNSNEDYPIDGIATDIINSPIDADKYDYLTRDSIACGVVYGLGVDKERLLLALTVSARMYNNKPRFALSYKAKGASAIESLLLARYQMFGAVYWHHTYRCIQAMYSQAASNVFSFSGKQKKFRTSTMSFNTLKEIVYHWVVCEKSLKNVEVGLKNSMPREMNEEVPSIVSGERAIELIWKFADDNVRKLIENLCKRELYKRVYEISIGELGDGNDNYFKLREELKIQDRHAKANMIGENILNCIGKEMSQRGAVESITENAAKERLKQLKQSKVPKIVIDFPTRGIPDENNFPTEISDSSRKYLSGPIAGKPTRQIFSVVRNLQIQGIVLRIYASPDLHELIIRYLETKEVEACIKDVITTLKT
jgi:HD superfamily phosphohydrolase